MDEGPHITNTTPGHGIRGQHKTQNTLGTRQFNTEFNGYKRNWTREQPFGTRKKKEQLTE